MIENLRSHKFFGIPVITINASVNCIFIWFVSKIMKMLSCVIIKYLHEILNMHDMKYFIDLSLKIDDIAEISACDRTCITDQCVVIDNLQHYRTNLNTNILSHMLSCINSLCKRQLFFDEKSFELFDPKLNVVNTCDTDNAVDVKTNIHNLTLCTYKISNNDCDLLLQTNLITSSTAIADCNELNIQLMQNSGTFVIIVCIQDDIDNDQFVLHGEIFEYVVNCLILLVFSVFLSFDEMSLYCVVILLIQTANVLCYGGLNRIIDTRWLDASSERDISGSQ